MYCVVEEFVISVHSSGALTPLVLVDSSSSDADQEGGTIGTSNSGTSASTADSSSSSSSSRNAKEGMRYEPMKGLRYPRYDFERYDQTCSANEEDGNREYWDSLGLTTSADPLGFAQRNWLTTSVEMFKEEGLLVVLSSGNCLCAVFYVPDLLASCRKQACQESSICLLRVGYILLHTSTYLNKVCINGMMYSINASTEFAKGRLDSLMEAFTQKDWHCMMYREIIPRDTDIIDVSINIRSGLNLLGSVEADGKVFLARADGKILVYYG